MLTVLAFRNLVVKKGRSLLLLLGYGLGVGVMIVLLSVGEAMVDQSRDVSLVGGGELTVLPQGIDVEAMRTGGVSGMFFSIGRARFLTRQLLGGPRQSRMVRAVSPVIENKLVYLRHGNQVIAARAGGEIPSRAGAVGAGLRVLDGAWRDGASDSAWISPTPEQLYHELDRFHLPPVSDSSWAEWHYFNLSTAPGEWWYITYLVGGEVPDGRWGGRLLVSHRNPDGSYQRYTADVPGDSVVFDTARADLGLGASSVRQRDGVYHLTGRARGAAGTLGIDLEVHPDRNKYFPPVDFKEGAYLSGYVVPVLSGRASGTLCVAGQCRSVRAAPAYHDHNWGIWRDVTWDWGAARGREFNLLYGAIYTPDDTVFTGQTGAPRIFVALVDSLGVRQIFRARELHYHDAKGGAARQRVRAPAGFEFIAAREEDSVQVRATIVDFQATAATAAGGRRFLQMRGSFILEGHVAGVAVADSGTGFFETYIE
jgi:hypothetical protein